MKNDSKIRNPMLPLEAPLETRIVPACLIWKFGQQSISDSSVLWANFGNRKITNFKRKTTMRCKPYPAYERLICVSLQVSPVQVETFREADEAVLNTFHKSARIAKNTSPPRPLGVVFMRPDDSSSSRISPVLTGARLMATASTNSQASAHDGRTAKLQRASQ